MLNNMEQVDITNAVSFSERELPILWKLSAEDPEGRKEVGLLIERAMRKGKGLPEKGINEDKLSDPTPLP